MADYTLRDVPDDLWRRVKIQAATNGETIRELLLRLLERETKTPPKR